MARTVVKGLIEFIANLRTSINKHSKTDARISSVSRSYFNDIENLEQKLTQMEHFKDVQ